MNTARQLRARAALAGNAIGPDDTSFTISATLSPRLINFWARWADVEAADRVFVNMTVLEIIALIAQPHLTKFVA